MPDRFTPLKPLTTSFFAPLSRRRLLGTGVAGALGPSLALAQGIFAAPHLLARRALQFPRDLGSHPDTAIEWWYVTGALQAQDQHFGFQLTFFRSRVASTQTMRSAFAAKQLIFAHAAVTDVANQRLLHDQRIARHSGNTTKASVDLAHVSELDTDVSLHDWSLRRNNGSYLALVKTREFAFNLTFTETQPLLLQGDQGLSRKGPQAEHASYYYSLPQLRVMGDLTLGLNSTPVIGRAWLDHEWSQSIMPPQAVGWDWIGMNLADGSTLTAFRLRDSTGAAVWSGGSWRDARGTGMPEIFAPQQVVLRPVRYWQSPATTARYPVEWEVQAGQRRYTVRALVDNQELDSRGSTGAVYWEGLSELLAPQGQVVGRGYLEMTGYVSPLKL
ncbi:MAG: carotenoid 1,2-hydratase [Comamonadaceae bacterium CG_4_9_14_0_8_um_filter_60_18]|nr:carotenoid 1,2-hydratase [Rhodoferax sp.]OIP21965.1 MAG: carotenoid 1,2-hydratase [Comamonadaceae bacterium CG2_30_60_41]PJC16170.1 MAG: carotenoid 1,2-hydratase [Comamonadaceae bacterium CG_4_9_14_0_8_um_filter_60_18]